MSKKVMKYLNKARDIYAEFGNRRFTDVSDLASIVDIARMLQSEELNKPKTGGGCSGGGGGDGVGS